MKGAVLNKRYELVELLGEGGFAVVWRARDTRLRRDVAIKLLKLTGEVSATDSAADPIQSFQREAQAVAQLNHANIVTVYDVGLDGSTAYMAMELLPGSDLARELLRRKQQKTPYTLDEALALLRPIASALEAAHAVGLIHRDIKPQNILFAADGRVVLTDFGLFKLVEDPNADNNLPLTRHNSSSGGVKGTTPYMAPEQVQAKRITAQTDVYGLTVVLLEMLMGQRPFVGASPYEMMDNIVRQPRSKLKALLPSLDEPVVNAILRGVTIQADQRPESPLAWLEGIEQCVTDGLMKQEAAEAQAARAEAIEQVQQLVQQQRFDAAYTKLDSLLERSPNDRQLTQVQQWIARNEQHAQRGAIEHVETLLDQSAWSEALAAIGTLNALRVDSATIAQLRTEAADGQLMAGRQSVQETTPTNVKTFSTYLIWMLLGLFVGVFGMWGIGRLNNTNLEADATPPVLVALTSPIPAPTITSEQINIPAGSFQTGNTIVNVDAFQLDKTEVTNTQYAAFLNAIETYETGCLAKRCSDVVADDEDSRIELTNGQFNVVNGYEQHPVVEVTWYGAAAYCEWHGGRLPTEAEWEYAAGGPESLEYPWGNEFDGNKTNSGQNGRSGTEIVGSYPDGASPFGVLDMAGNVWEWTQSKYVDYPYDAEDGRNKMDGDEWRVLRGGSWYSLALSLRASNRDLGGPSLSNDNVGFRCAQEVSP